MERLQIAQRRLHNQLLARNSSEGPGHVVAWLGAVQSQDYAGAKWALGQRLTGSTDAGIEQAFADGAILRTHVLRPTWHFVPPADIRWMLALTAPRVNALNAYYYRKLRLDDAIFARSNDLMARALEGGNYLTRTELMAVLQQSGLDTSDLLRCTHLAMRAELDAVICSGPRRGKQFTYALLDERAPQARVLARDEALAELARRYFTSHGPATLLDFAWWSGLTVPDAKAGLAMAGQDVTQENIDGKTYYSAASQPPMSETTSSAYLLPNFDEYTVGYAGRSAIFDEVYSEKLGPRSNILSNVVIIDGQVRGTWKRELQKDEVIIEMSLFASLNPDEEKAVTDAAESYGRFLGLEARII